MGGLRGGTLGHYNGSVWRNEHLTEDSVARGTSLSLDILYTEGVGGVLYTLVRQSDQLFASLGCQISLGATRH